MGVVYKSDLIESNSSKTMQPLTNIVESSNKLIEKIDTILAESTAYMSGDAFTIITNKLSLYKDALSKQSQICSILQNNLESANNVMINYLSEFDMIDDSEKDKIRQSLDRIDYLLELIDKYNKSSEENALSSQFDLYNLGLTKTELEKYYSKIEGLASKDRAAYSLIEGVNLDVNNYYTAIGGVNTGWKSPYYNLGNRDIMYYHQKGYRDTNGEYRKWESNWRSYDGYDIAKSGCGPTSFAMVLATINHSSNYTPSSVADDMDEKNITNSSNLPMNLAEQYGLNCDYGKFDADLIEEVINNGGAYMGSMNDGEHFIAVLDVVYIDGQRYFAVCDPMPSSDYPEEPYLVTAEELHSTEYGISMNFYIVPPDIEVVVDPDDEIRRVHLEYNN